MEQMIQITLVGVLFSVIILVIILCVVLIKRHFRHRNPVVMELGETNRLLERVIDQMQELNNNVGYIKSQR